MEVVKIKCRLILQDKESLYKRDFVALNKSVTNYLPRCSLFFLLPTVGSAAVSIFSIRKFITGRIGFWARGAGFGYGMNFVCDIYLVSG